MKTHSEILYNHDYTYSVKISSISSFTVVMCLTVYISVYILYMLKKLLLWVIAIAVCTFVELVYIYLVSLFNGRKEEKVEMLGDVSRLWCS